MIMDVLRTKASASGRDQDILIIGVAQIAPVWLKRTRTLEKVCAVAELAAAQGCRLVVFGEALGARLSLGRRGDPLRRIAAMST